MAPDKYHQSNCGNSSRGYAGGRSCPDDSSSSPSSGTLAISNAGGQTWTSETQQNADQLPDKAILVQVQWHMECQSKRFLQCGSTNSNTVVMHVFRPSNANSVWQVDVAQVSANFAAPGAPHTVTIPGITTITDGALVFAAWASRMTIPGDL